MSATFEGKQFLVITKEGTQHTVTEMFVERSPVLKEMLQMCNSAEEPIPLTNVDNASLAHVLKWCENRTGSEGSAEMSKWEAEWIAKVRPIEQAALMIVANFLGMEALLNVAAKGTADNIRGKSPDEIIEAFEIPREELAEAKRQKREEPK